MSWPSALTKIPMLFWPLQGPLELFCCHREFLVWISISSLNALLQVPFSNIIDCPWRAINYCGVWFPCVYWDFVGVAPVIVMCLFDSDRHQFLTRAYKLGMMTSDYVYFGYNRIISNATYRPWNATGTQPQNLPEEDREIYSRFKQVCWHVAPNDVIRNCLSNWINGYIWAGK